MITGAAAAVDTSIAAVDQFVDLTPREVRRAPQDHVISAAALQQQLQQASTNRNSISLRHLPVEKVTEGKSLTARRAKNFVSVANAITVAAPQKPSLSTALVHSLAKHSALGSIVEHAGALLLAIGKSPHVNSPSTRQLEATLKSIVNSSGAISNSEPYMPLLKKSLAIVGESLLNENIIASPKYEIISH